MSPQEFLQLQALHNNLIQVTMTEMKNVLTQMSNDKKICIHLNDMSNALDDYLKKLLEKPVLPISTWEKIATLSINLRDTFAPFKDKISEMSINKNNTDILYNFCTHLNLTCNILHILGHKYSDMNDWELAREKFALAVLYSDESIVCTKEVKDRYTNPAHKQLTQDMLSATESFHHILETEQNAADKRIEDLLQHHHASSSMVGQLFAALHVVKNNAQHINELLPTVAPTSHNLINKDVQTYRDQLKQCATQLENISNSKEHAAVEINLSHNASSSSNDNEPSNKRQKTNHTTYSSIFSNGTNSSSSSVASHNSSTFSASPKG